MCILFIIIFLIYTIRNNTIEDDEYRYNIVNQQNTFAERLKFRQKMVKKINKMNINKNIFFSFTIIIFFFIFLYE
jgi:hypothetical protein